MRSGPPSGRAQASGPPSLGVPTAAEQLLVALLRPDGGAPAAPFRREWDRFAALAAREQVSSLVLAATIERYGAVVPEEVRRALAAADARSRAHAAAAYVQLAALLRRFRRAGVAAALLKGAALSRFVYAGGGRGFHDLDLLVPLSDRGAAERVLIQAGYTTDHAATVDDVGERVYWDASWRRVPVDVHWRLDAGPVSLGLNCDGMLRRALSGTVEGEPVLLLGPADMLVALAAHFVKHVWGCRPRLRYLRDMAEVTRCCSVDWGQVVEAAVTAPRARSALRTTLGTAAELLGAAVAPAALDRLAPLRGPAVNRYLGALIRRRLLRGDTASAALLQVALMRWLDKDTVRVYPGLVASLLEVRTRRLAAGVLGVRGRRALRRLRLRSRRSGAATAGAAAGSD